MKYWNNQGKHQDKLEELYSLIPNIGACDTQAGELLRSANRIYYDAFNNGFCNNTSGALNYLKNYLPFTEEKQKVIDTLKNCVNTGGYSMLTDNVNDALDTMIDLVIEAIIEFPSMKETPPICDLFDLQEEDAECEEYY